MKKQILTDKQERFCQKYIECLDLSEAYRYAYNCENMKAPSVNRKAFELIQNVNVSAMISRLKAKLAEKTEITKERVLAEYANVAFSSIADMHKTWIDRKDFESLTPAQKSCIRSISTRVRKITVDSTPMEVEEIKIELCDKLKALDSITKMLGYDAPIKAEITTNMPATIIAAFKGEKIEINGDDI